MSKALILSLLLLTTLVPTAVAAQDLCRYVCVNDCSSGNVCLVVRTSPDVCAAVGIGYQGTGACVSPQTGCIVVQVGFWREYVCEYISFP